MSAISLFVASLLSLNAQQTTQQCQNNCRISLAGLELVSHFEGYSPFVYRDSAGLETIGIGHLVLPGEKFDEPLLPDDANNLLKKDAGGAEKSVSTMVVVKLRQNQADALICFTFNVGGGSLSKSTLLKRVNQERHDEVPPEFGKWVYAGGKKIRGLELRREAESALYKS